MDKDLKKKLEIAQIFHQQNKLDLAKKTYKNLLEDFPANINILYLLGTLEIQTKNYKSGIYHLLQAINQNSKIAPFHNNIAVAYNETENFKDALKHVNKAIFLKKDYFEAFNNKGNIYMQQNKFHVAIECYKEAINLNPNYAEAHNNMGNTYKELKMFEYSKKCYELALKINKNYLNAYINLGNVLHELKRTSESIEIFKNCIKSNPHSSDAYINLGKVFLFKNDFKNARYNIEKAIVINPNNHLYHNDFGKFFHKIKKYNDALKSFETALSLKPNSIEYLNNIAICYFRNNKFNKAIDYFKKSLLLKNTKEAHNFMGHAFKSLKQFSFAKASYLQAIKLDPNYAYSYLNLGNLFKEHNELDEAIVAYKKAFKINNKLEFLNGILFHSKMMICDWEDIDLNMKKITKQVHLKKKIIRPFASLALFDNLEINMLVAKIFFESKYISNNEKNKFSKNSDNQKIRIGYFSSDFQENHPVGHLLADFFKNHDKDKFEIYVFSLLPALTRNDNFRENLKKNVNFFYDLENNSDDEIVSLSLSINLDIAIDLNGHTQNSRTMIFSRGIAPIQVNFLGYPGTMGANCYDYIICDEYVIPKIYQKYYNEKTLYMPNSYLINPSFRKVSKKKFTKELFSIPEGTFVFCCFNNSYKILPNIFESWCKILKNVENSILWMADTNNEAKKNLFNNFSKQRVDTNKIFFAKRLENVEDHLARYKFVDLFLDTYPYNAHTTACDALYMGVPVLTLFGKTFASRVGLSLLKNLKMDEFISKNKKEYEEKAIFFGNNKIALNKHKQKLKVEVISNPLFNSKLYVKNLENIFTDLVKL